MEIQFITYRNDAGRCFCKLENHSCVHVRILPVTILLCPLGDNDASATFVSWKVFIDRMKELLTYYYYYYYCK